MYKTQLRRVCTEKGESIEEMLRRLSANNEGIPDQVPAIYTPRAEGVLPDTDIRTDRFDIAIEASTKFEASDTARSAEIAAEIQSGQEQEKEAA